MTSKIPSAARGARLRRTLLAGVCVLLLGFQTGCYTLLPMQMEPPVGIDRVQVVLNDRGRFQMESVLGQGVDVVEGVVSRQDSASIEVQVAKVTTIRGATSTWTGEAVTIPRDGISGFRGRQLSKVRSWVLAGVVVGVLVFSAVVLGLDGLGGDPDNPPCTDPSCVPNPSIRW
jgi:hypothetical protein